MGRQWLFGLFAPVPLAEPFFGCGKVRIRPCCRRLDVENRVGRSKKHSLGFRLNKEKLAHVAANPRRSLCLVHL